MRMILSFLLTLNVFAFAQDSLYCVNTLVGDSVNKIIFAKGAGDINGDGYDDLVVSFSDSVKIYLGNDRFELKPAYSYGNNNGFVLCPGDVNGDGYADLLIGEKRFETGTHGHISNINLFFGSEDGMDTCKTFGYEVSLWDQIFSKNVEPIGDVNGDGFTDFAISSPYNWGNGISYVYLYLGGDSISSEPFATFTNYMTEHSLGTFGESVCGIRDVNADGFDDILIGDPGYDDTLYAESSGAVYLFYGGAEMDSVADSILTGNKEDNFGYDIDNLGDINGNGHQEFAISELGYVYFYEFPNGIFRIYDYLNIGGGGDINNDGYNDFLLGNIQYINENGVMVGGAFLFYGSAEQDTIFDSKLEGETQWSDFSRELDIFGDFNKDEYDDFYILAPLYPDDQNEKGKLYLYSYKKINGIKDTKNTVMNTFRLFPGYPNPFNSRTIIPYYLKTTSAIKAEIYDIGGRLIKSLYSGQKPAGRHQLAWNGKTNSGSAAASGIYLIVIKQGKNNTNILSNKIVLIK